jgi:5,5'-dehydrodivanillate O-demethylase
VATTAYPVEELGGLLWAYLGPEPRPLLPRFDGFVAEGAVRMMGRALLPVNWLQIMENSLDPIHTEWLHGHHYEFQKEQEGVKVAISTRHEKIDFREFEFGITKHRLLAGHSEEGDDWRIGHPSCSPTSWRWATATRPRATTRSRSACRSTTAHHAPLVQRVHSAEGRGRAAASDRARLALRRSVPDENGEFIVDNIDGQDMMAWITQGAIADRTREHLGASDKGVAMYRRALKREIRSGGRARPDRVVRDPARNTRIDLPNERKKHHNSDGFASFMLRTHARYSPIAQDVIRIFEGARAAAAASGGREPVPQV